MAMSPRALALALLLLLLPSPSVSLDAAGPSPSPSPAPAPLGWPPRQAASPHWTDQPSPPGGRYGGAHHDDPAGSPEEPRRGLNFGERLGIAFAGVAVAMQVALGAFLVVRARQLRAGEEGSSPAASAAPPA